ncbi:MAG: hypothetical protein JXB18_00355 [Sedimentisphaerales bacterium]|nr:hypothetical protein [Sedimentisphaerales bacterium]
MRIKNLLVATVLVLAGCRLAEEQIIPLTAPQPEVPQEPAPLTVQQDAASLERRFTSPSDSQLDPVQTITLWAQRYEESSRQNEQLRENSSKLVLENARLMQDNEKLKLELAQCRKDMEQSNALLEQAHVELSKWKADVLGFREEIRQAQTAQLSALTKILRVLGAESPAAQTDTAQETQP